jgi:nucleoside-diphosphate-sugar epimerase
MQVFIAGATGVIGTNLIPLLLAREHTVRGLSTNQEGAARLNALGAQSIVGNLLEEMSPSAVAAWIAGCDAIVHVATALGKHPEAPSAEALKRTGELRTGGARRLLQAARQCGVRNYIQESIELAYPDSGDEWIDESTPLDTSPGRAAICAPVIEMERLVTAAGTPDLRCTILRGGRLVGTGTGQDNAIEALRNGTLRVSRDGSHFISPVHVKDYARAIVHALETPNPPSVVNINDTPVQERAYYDMLADAFGLPHAIRDAQRPAPPSHRCSAALASATLKWTPKEPLIEQALMSRVREGPRLGVDGEHEGS